MDQERFQAWLSQVAWPGTAHRGEAEAALSGGSQALVSLAAFKAATFRGWSRSRGNWRGNGWPSGSSGAGLAGSGLVIREGPVGTRQPRCHP